jgi:CRISPR-associated endonuclease/helicase Cas3
MIVVSAGEAASGLDLPAALVVAEAAPWPSMVRRIGRASRSGARPAAETWWLPPPAPADGPGEGSAEGSGEGPAVAAACAELARLEGVSVTEADLLARAVPGARPEVAHLGGDALLALFDTATPDPGVDRYVRDPGEPDVEVAWAEWSQREAGAPDPEVRFPSPEHRCRVPLGAAVSLAASRPAWRFDRAAGQWLRVTAESSLHPYDLLLVAAADGGYHPDAGFDPAAPGPVPGCPVLLTPDEAKAGAALLAGGPVATASRGWQSLGEHSEQVRDQAAALLAVLRPAIPAAAARAAIVAGYLHDVGKAHPTWQDALCALADESAVGLVAAGRPWAKSGTDGRLEFAGGVTFRHELASLLLIDGPLRSLLAASPDADLTRYLVLAHHGLLRVRVGDPGNPDDPGDPGAPGTSRPPGAPGTSRPPGTPDTILGLAQGATSDIPPLLGQPAATLTVDLGQFRPDGNAADRSWAGTVAGLLDRYGPFTLAYLETVVRVADWRASGGRELPEPVGPRLRSGESPT